MLGPGRLTFAFTCLALLSARAGAQRFFNPYASCGSPPIHNIKYDGKFTFARLAYTGQPGNCYYRGEPSWAHGYGYTQSGTAESNLMKIMQSVSRMRAHVDATNVLRIDDPELCKYPVAFLVEAGYLDLSDREVKGLHDYLTKGGFLIIDDSREDYGRGQSGWANLVGQMALVLPGLHPIDVTPSHPIFHAFYEISSFDIVPQYYDPGRPIFRAIFANNDPTQRMLVMINFNTDVSNFWEFSASGFTLVDESNQAYKLGVNYLMYALTH